MNYRNEFAGEFKKARVLVLKRDGNRCVKCGLNLSLEIHHIEGYKNNKIGSLVTLCYLCHGIAPMGKDLFKQWLLLGEDGIEVIRRTLLKYGLRKISREQITIFCQALAELRILTNGLKMRAGRERRREIEGRCEGRLPYGTYKDESKILERILALYNSGNNYENIARILNHEGIKTRYGKTWFGATVRRIIKRDIAQVGA